MIELACPETCSYLIDARTSAVQRETAIRRRETAGEPRDLVLNERAIHALDTIERAIVSVQRGAGGERLRDLDDAEILAAVENTIRNLETEESGLIYQHRSASLRITELVVRVRDALKEMNDELPAEARPRTSEILKALTFTRDAARAHTQRAGGYAESARSYIRYISLYYPWPKETARPIII